MIRIEVADSIVVVVPRGEYAAAELAAAVERALALCPGGTARGLIIDFSWAPSVGQQAIVRVRETARHVARHGNRFASRAAVIASADDAARVMSTGAAISVAQGIECRFCRDRDEATWWLRDERAQLPV